MSFIHEDCGRYPLSEEGIPAIRRRLPGMPCLNRQLGTDAGWEFKNVPDIDGQGENFVYSSDGTRYLIKASNGYSVTDASSEKNSQYWDNPVGGLPYPTFRKPYSDRIVVSFWVLVSIFGAAFFFPINQFSKALSRRRQAFARIAFVSYLAFFAVVSLELLVHFSYQF